MYGRCAVRARGRKMERMQEEHGCWIGRAWALHGVRVRALDKSKRIIRALDKCKRPCSATFYHGSRAKNPKQFARLGFNALQNVAGERDFNLVNRCKPCVRGVVRS